MEHPAIRRITTVPNGLLEITREEDLLGLPSPTRKWYVNYPLQRMHYYATRKDVAKLIMRFRRPGQITALSTLDFLVGW